MSVYSKVNLVLGIGALSLLSANAQNSAEESLPIGGKVEAPTEATNEALPAETPPAEAPLSSENEKPTGEEKPADPPSEEMNCPDGEQGENPFVSSEEPQSQENEWGQLGEMISEPKEEKISKEKEPAKAKDPKEEKNQDLPPLDLKPLAKKDSPVGKKPEPSKEEKLPEGWDKNIATLKVLSPSVKDGGLVKVPSRAGQSATWWFSPVLLNDVPEGWVVRAAPELGLHQIQVRLKNGKDQALKVPMYVLDVERDGGFFGVIEPGFEIASGYVQSKTIGGALSENLRQMKKDGEAVDQALNQLNQLLKALPDQTNKVENAEISEQGPLSEAAFKSSTPR